MNRLFSFWPRLLLLVGVVLGVGALCLSGNSHAADTLTLAANMESGTCRDTFTGEAETTQTVSLEYRHESEGFSVMGYGRKAPSGGNCADDAFTFDTEIERRFQGPGDFYGLVRVGAERYVSTGVFRHVGGDGLVLFANQTDGSPAYTALVGVGRCFGRFCAEAGLNLAPNDYVGNEGAQSGHFNVSYSHELLGGNLEIALEAETPDTDFSTLVTGQRVNWSRQLAANFDLSIGYRRRAGLDEYLSPFDASTLLDGREYFLGVTDGVVSTFEVGISARF